VAFGANLERPFLALHLAEELLGLEEGLRFAARSGVWLTEPVGGPPGQDWYHNQVLLYETGLEAEKILELLLKTESALGRARRERWGPRIIDLDLIFLDGEVAQSGSLTLPHPRLQDRAFVLKPLLEVAPGWTHPVSGLALLDLLSRLPRGGPSLRRL
jgi:2-amino-4-hydroxy-6-hydroxymethyldihydropteridine diphosphokinase